METTAEIEKMTKQEFNDFYKKWYQQPLDKVEQEVWRVGVCEKVHFGKRMAVAQEILKNNHQNICDLGCGGGQLLEVIRKAGFTGKLIGLDKELHPQFLKRVMNFNLLALAGDYQQYKSNKHDGIIFFSSLHYATLDEVEKIISNTSPCKKYYIVEAFLHTKHPGNEKLHQIVQKKTDGECGCFIEKELDSVFEKNGFTKKRIHTYPIDILGRTHTFVSYTLI